MTLTLYPPLAFSQPGQRDNNEDFVSPVVGMATTDSRVFVVCDGVGGGALGEVASRLVANGMVRWFSDWDGPSTEQDVLAALRSAEQALDTYLQQHSDATGMATTLTLLHLHERGATVAHVGDSRVYCCREGRIIFQTDDHKLVNEWVKNGILTPEQAANHPQHNVITRAVRGSAKPAQADVALLTGLRAGDYFFMCTDGVLEQLTPNQLTAILASNRADEAKLTAIQQCCDGQTHDNYSGYLVHLQSVDSADGNEYPPDMTPRANAVMPAPARSPLVATRKQAMAPASPMYRSATGSELPKRVTARATWGRWSPYVVAGAVVALLTFWLLTYRRSDPQVAVPRRSHQHPLMPIRPSLNPPPSEHPSLSQPTPTRRL